LPMGGVVIWPFEVCGGQLPQLSKDAVSIREIVKQHGRVPSQEDEGVQQCLGKRRIILMKRTIFAAVAGALMLGASALPTLAAGKTIAVSWKTFQEERWKTDEAAIKAAVEAAGNTYISTDAQGSAQKQAADIESLIAQKPDVVLVVAFDSDAILPSIKALSDAGIKSIAYDVQFEDPNALYITFDNVGVGRIIAKEVMAVKPEGQYAIIKGDKGDPNATFLFNGMMEVIGESVKAGKINIACETFTDGWKPDNAQKNMEQCLTSTGNKIDAVLSENDGMASGVVAALTAQGMAGIPVGGQDGDLAAINRVGLGTQTVSVWKNAKDLGKVAGEAANMLADGKGMADIPGVGKFADGKNKVEMNAILLSPTPITKGNINVAIEAGHITKEQACAGVAAGAATGC
jgi:D-xylose transport system substrate-binding protein